MTTFYLTDPKTLETTAFEEVDADMMRLEVRSGAPEQGRLSMSFAFYERGEARRLWATLKGCGRVEAPSWPLELSAEEEDCHDPEYHDGEPCDGGCWRETT